MLEELGCHNLYYIEAIVGKHKLKGTEYYEAKWKGFPKSENTLQTVDTL